MPGPGDPLRRSAVPALAAACCKSALETLPQKCVFTGSGAPATVCTGTLRACVYISDVGRWTVAEVRVRAARLQPAPAIENDWSAACDPDRIGAAISRGSHPRGT